MDEKMIHSEKLFSYGTLQYETVQLNTFGRKLQGNSDTLSGFKLSMININDENVIATSGDATHPIVIFTGNPTDQVAGVVFEISKQELEQADAYEIGDYKRIRFRLNSGLLVWVYVDVHTETIDL